LFSLSMSSSPEKRSVFVALKMPCACGMPDAALLFPAMAVAEAVDEEDEEDGSSWCCCCWAALPSPVA
jgi:hypothetical protein